MKTRVDTYADLLAILDDLQGQCAEAKHSYENSVGNTDLEELWLQAANALSFAIGRCEDARDKFMGTAKAKRAA